MAKHGNDINQVKTPIELAARMFQEQQGRVLSTILGPDGEQRQRNATAESGLEAIILSQLDALDDTILPIVGK